MQSFFIKKSANIVQKQLAPQVEKKAVSQFSKKAASKISQREKNLLVNLNQEATLFQTEKNLLKTQGVKINTAQVANKEFKDLQVERAGIAFTSSNKAKNVVQAQILSSKNAFAEMNNNTKLIYQQKFNKSFSNSALVQVEKLVNSEKLFEKLAQQQIACNKLSNKAKTAIFAFLATFAFAPAIANEHKATFESDPNLKAVKDLLEQNFQAYTNSDQHGNQYVDVHDAYEILKEVYFEGFGFNIRRRMKKEEVNKLFKSQLKAHDGKVYLIEFKRIFKFIHDKMIDDFLTHQFKEFDKDSTGSLDENEFIQLTLSTYENLLSNNEDAAFMKQTITTAAKSKFKELDTDGNGTLEYDEFKKGFLDSILMTMNQTSQIRDLGKFRKFLKKQFDSHDKDSTGTIDDDEFFDMMLELHAKGFWGKQLEKKEVLDLVKEFDANSDGSMDIYEYESLFKTLYRKQRDEGIYAVEKSCKTKDDQFISKQEAHEMMAKLSTILFRINYKQITGKIDNLFDEYSKKGRLSKKDFKDFAIDVAEEMLFKIYHDLEGQ